MAEVTPAERANLEDILGPYLAELGAPKTYPYLPLYWTDPARYPYFMECGGRVAGFALVRGLAPSGGCGLAEFCVLASFRRRGVGAAALDA